MSINGEGFDVFISTPFGEKTYDQIQREFLRVRRIVANKINNKWIRVIPSYILLDPPEPCTCDGLWYLGKSIEKLAKADLVVFTPEWDKARGCIIEHRCAELYKLPIMELTKEDYD